MKLFYSIILILIKFSILAQNYFQKAYGGNDNENGTCFDQREAFLNKTTENNYLIANSSASFGNGIPGSKSSQIIKLSQAGDTIFTRYYYENGHKSSRACSVDQTRDGNYIVAIDYDQENYGLGLLKINVNGDTIWSRAFQKIEMGFSHTLLRSHSGIALKDNSYLITGIYEGQYGKQLAIGRLDSSGNNIFGKRYNIANKISLLYSSAQLSDGNILSVGHIYNTGNRDVLLMKTNIDGSIIWCKSYNLGNNEMGYSVIEDSNKNIYLTGFWGDSGINCDFFITKTDSIGNVIYSKRYGIGNIDQWARAIALDPSNNIYVVGSELDLTTPPYNQLAFSMKTDNLGNIIWCNKYKNISSAGSLILVNNNELAFTGWTDKFGAGLADSYLVKTNNTGDLGCDIIPITFTSTTNSYTITSLSYTINSDLTLKSVPLNTKSGGIITTKCQSTITTSLLSNEFNEQILNIYPNPSNGIFEIIASADIEIKNIVVTNSIGQVVLLSNNKTQIDISSLNNGIYFINFFLSNSNKVVKIFKN